VSPPGEFVLWLSLPTGKVSGSFAHPNVKDNYWELLMYITCLHKSRLFALFIIFSLWHVGFAYCDKPAAPSWESQKYLIEGVHYLMNEDDLDTAEQLFHKAILSSSFDSLSIDDDLNGTADTSDSWVVAESLYFLGKIHYLRANSQIDVKSNIIWAKKYLMKAEEYGIIYDKLHNPLLDEIKRKYPDVNIPVTDAIGYRAKVTIESDNGSYNINAVKIDKRGYVTELDFQTDKESVIEGGARYKLKPDIRGKRRAILGSVSAVGVILAIWLLRG
jgi:hypothetical protein